MKTFHPTHLGDVIATTTLTSPMNRRPSVLAGFAGCLLWVCSLCWGLLPLQAAFWGVYHLPHLEQLDFDGDQVSDLAMIQNGELWLRYDAARQTSDWQRIPVDVPFSPVQGEEIRVASGDINHDGFDDLAIAAAGANRVLVIFGQRDHLAPPGTQEINVPGGPTDMDLFHSTADGSVRMSILAMETAEPYEAQVSNSDPAEPLMVVRSLLEMDDDHGDAHLDYLVTTMTDTGPLHVFWLHQPPANGGIESEPVLSWFGPSAAEIQGRYKYQDITLKRGYTTVALTYIPNPDWTPAIVAWGDGLSEITVLAPDPDSTSADMVNESISLNFVELDFQTNAASSKVLVTRNQGRELAIYQWSETVELELVETLVAPDGKKFLATAGLSDGGLATLLGTAGGADPIASTLELGMYALRNGRLVLDFQSALPAFSPRPVLSRVVVYDRDPFVDSQAREIESLAAGDWARNAQISDSTVTVLSATFLDSLRGLGAGTLQTLPLTFTPPRGAFALANQWETDSSIFFGAPPAVPGSATVLAQPPPGSHPGPVQLEFMTDEGVIVVSRVGDGAWREGHGPYAIGQTSLVEYYGTDAAGRASPRQSGQYIITQATHAPEGPLLADTDGDGLDDAWERLLFGGLDPSSGVDHDGDGFSTGEEYSAGTDPRDPNSRPDGEPETPLLLDTRLTNEGRLALTWLGAADDPFGVDISPDLLQWTRSTAPTEYIDGVHHWEDPEPIAGSRFYRITRLP